MSNIEVLKSTVIEVLRYVPHRPFLCLPMSAILYAVLKDKHGICTKLVTGNISYKNQYIFKQDFSITRAKDSQLQYWSGHAWIEIDGLICDLSFFRTLYSDEFVKPIKADLVKHFGEGKGCIIAAPSDMPLLKYEPIDCVSDTMATSIIKGFEALLSVK